MIEIGSVVKIEGQLYVVTKIKAGEIQEKEPIDKFIAKRVVFSFTPEEVKTIQEIIDIYVNKYLAKRNVIEL